MPDPLRLGVIYYVPVRTFFEVFAWQDGQDGSRGKLNARRPTYQPENDRSVRFEADVDSCCGGRNRLSTRGR